MAKDRELLPPEDAASLEEFQARRHMEQVQIRGMNGSWKTIGLMILCGPVLLADIICWAGVADKQAGAGRWVLLVFGLLFAGLFMRIFGKIELRGVRGSRRYMQLTGLSKEWQARARNGEIPEKTPGGPKVWRDELETEQPSS